VHPRYRVPHHAEVALGVAVCALVLTLDLRGAIGFSSFGVLLYYLVANLSAFTQAREHRRFPRWLQVVGAGACAVLVVTLPLTLVLTGAVVFGVGVAYRLWRRRAAARR
jgi:basic amino acid/polyamine antiporter, APA family